MRGRVLGWKNQRLGSLLRGAGFGLNLLHTAIYFEIIYPGEQRDDRGRRTAAREGDEGWGSSEGERKTRRKGCTTGFRGFRKIAPVNFRGNYHRLPKPGGIVAGGRKLSLLGWFHTETHTCARYTFHKYPHCHSNVRRHSAFVTCNIGWLLFSIIYCITTRFLLVAQNNFTLSIKIISRKSRSLIPKEEFMS